MHASETALDNNERKEGRMCATWGLIAPASPPAAHVRVPFPFAPPIRLRSLPSAGPLDVASLLRFLNSPFRFVSRLLRLHEEISPNVSMGAWQHARGFKRIEWRIQTAQEHGSGHTACRHNKKLTEQLKQSTALGPSRSRPNQLNEPRMLRNSSPGRGGRGRT